MSNWTHVAGIIRIDGFNDYSNTNFDDLLGRECHWKSPVEVWDDMHKHPELYLPMGSEGSLEKFIWKNPDGNSMPTYAVSIFGDLRDHDDPMEIINWFKDKCQLFWVRDAVISVYNEWNGVEEWSYRKEHEKKSKWIEKQVEDNENIMIEEWQSAKCSNCGKYHTTPYSYYFDDFNYCPNCGAKMEAGE